MACKYYNLLHKQDTIGDRNLTKSRFQWAACQLDVLEKCLDLHLLNKALASLPKTLHETYSRIVTAIPDEHKAYAVRILQFLTFSERPLSIEETVDAVTVNIEAKPHFDPDNRMPEPREISRYCSSLVAVVSTKSGDVLQLSHFSVKEYLTSHRLDSAIAREFDTFRASASIARVCLAYLLQFRQDINPDKVVQLFPLAEYSAKYWMSFTAVAERNKEDLTGLVERFFTLQGAPYQVCYSLYRPDQPWKNSEYIKLSDRPASPLYYAAFGGLQATVQMLLDRNVDVNMQGGDYGNALQAASAQGHEQVVKMLLDSNTDVNMSGGYYGNALQAASAQGHEQVVKMLLDSTADMNAQGGRYSNALHAASAAGHCTIVQLLLENGADVNRQGELYNIALNAAAAESHTAVVKVLLRNGAVLSRYDIQGKSVLHHVTNRAHCDPSLVEFLLSQGAATDAADIENMTPLHYSVKFGHKSVAGLLLDKGAPIDSSVHRKTWDQTAAKTDATCPVFLSEPTTTMSGTSAGLTSLHFAALAGNTDMVKFLLERGADPNALSEYNETPLHLTLRKTLHEPKYDDGPNYDDDWTRSHWRVEGLLDLLDFEEDDVDAIRADITMHRESVLDALLADARTSVTVRDYQHEYPLHCVEYGQVGSVWMVKKLVSKGADPFERNLKQQNALHLALGVEPASTDSEGLNALHYAARSGDHETIAVLLETAVATRPSLVTSKDTWGRNLLHHLLSRAYGVRPETTQLLLDKGVDGLELDASGDSPLASYHKECRLGINVEISQQILSIKGSSLYVEVEGQSLGH
jgi:ankyrin repeat protein